MLQFYPFFNGPSFPLLVDDECCASLDPRGRHSCHVAIEKTCVHGSFSCVGGGCRCYVTDVRKSLRSNTSRSNGKAS